MATLESPKTPGAEQPANRRLGPNEKPFEKLIADDHNDMKDVYNSLNVIGKLSRFDLEYDDTAATARFMAGRAIRRFKIENQDAIQLLSDLRWLLKATGDCPTDQDFVDLMLNRETGDEGLEG